MSISICEISTRESVQSFLTEPRKRYFQGKLHSLLEVDQSDEGTSPNTAPLNDAIFSLCCLCDEFIQKLFYFLQSQSITLTSDDIPDLSKAFLELMGDGKLQVGNKVFSIEALGDWEDHIEMLLLEASTIILGGRKIGVDAVNELANTTVVNGLDTANRSSVINGFRKDVIARIEALINLKPVQKTELIDRTNYYCDDVFPQSCSEYDDPQACLELWLGLVLEYLEEHVTDIRAFMLEWESHEKAISEILMAHDGLIAKHNKAVKKYLQQNSRLFTGETLAQLRNTLIQFWLHKYMEDQTNSIGDLPFGAEEDEGNHSADMN